jgi:hypothetical protein
LCHQGWSCICRRGGRSLATSVCHPTRPTEESEDRSRARESLELPLLDLDERESALGTEVADDVRHEDLPGIGGVAKSPEYEVGLIPA